MEVINLVSVFVKIALTLALECFILHGLAHFFAQKSISLSNNVSYKVESFSLTYLEFDFLLGTARSSQHFSCQSAATWQVNRNTLVIPLPGM